MRKKNENEKQRSRAHDHQETDEESGVEVEVEDPEDDELNSGELEWLHLSSEVFLLFYIFYLCSFWIVQLQLFLRQLAVPWR